VERLVLKHPNTYVPGIVQIIIVILNGNCQLLLSPILPFLVLVLDRLWRMAEKSIASLYHQISQYFFPPPKESGVRTNGSVQHWADCPPAAQILLKSAVEVGVVEAKL
jgi:hypothetical protein